MSERSKYPINGICRFENFLERNRGNNFQKVPIGRICDFDRWYVTLRQKVHGGNIFIFPYLYCRPVPKHKQLAGRWYISCLNRNPLKDYQKISCGRFDKSRVPLGNGIKLDKLLDENSGWLNDGKLCIEYGFCVESMEGLDGIWKFNFHDKLFDFDQKPNMITFENHCPDKSKVISLHIHKQLLEFHSPSFKDVPCTIFNLWVGTNTEEFVEFLQMSHGVRIEVPYLLHIHEIAKRLNFLNVRRFCERLLIERDSVAQLCTLRTASHFHYNHYLALLLKRVESGKRLAAILKKMRLEEMSSEFMKQCTKYFFENSRTDIGK